MTILLLINMFFAGFSSMTVTTRIGFAMARDGAFPGSKYLYKVNASSQVPDRIIILVFVLDVLLVLLALISTTAFTGITSITAIGYQISYAIPILLRLTVSRNTFKKSDVNMGCLSVPIGWIAVLWLIATSIIFLLPTSFDANMNQTAAGFNYACVVVGGVLILASVYWYLPAPLGARHFFRGPKREPDSVSPVVTYQDVIIEDGKKETGNQR